MTLIGGLFITVLSFIMIMSVYGRFFKIYLYTAAGIYLFLKPYLGTEIVSWLCVLGVAPFAALGFIRCNAMKPERFLWAWVRSEFIIPKRLTFRAANLYYGATKSMLEGGTPR